MELTLRSISFVIVISLFLPFYVTCHILYKPGSRTKIKLFYSRMNYFVRLNSLQLFRSLHYLSFIDYVTTILISFLPVLYVYTVSDSLLVSDSSKLQPFPSRSWLSGTFELKNILFPCVIPFYSLFYPYLSYT